MINELVKRLREKVNASPVYQSLFYDLNLLPEQIGDDLGKWATVETIVNHFEEAALAAQQPQQEPVAESSSIRLVSIFDDSGITHTRTADEWLMLARNDLKRAAPPSGVREGMLRLNPNCRATFDTDKAWSCNCPHKHPILCAEAEKLPQSQVVVPVESLQSWHDFWAHYSSLNEGSQDDLNNERHQVLDEMLYAAQEKKS
jgi:hypothetical protein